MMPPEWILKNATRLDLDEFQSQFATAWSKIDLRFLKLECWQRYQKLAASESQDAYSRGDIAHARELLTREAEGDRSLYEDIGTRGAWITHDAAAITLLEGKAAALRQVAIPLAEFRLCR